MELVSLTLGGVQVQAALDSARGLLVLFEADVQRAGGTYQPRESSAPRRTSRSRSRTCSSYSGEWRRSPSPLCRRPPTPPPPPPRRAQPAARGGEVSEPERPSVPPRDSRRRPRQSPTQSCSRTRQPPYGSVGRHQPFQRRWPRRRHRPFWEHPGSNSVPGRLLPPCCAIAGGAQCSCRSDRPAALSSSPFFLQPVPQTCLLGCRPGAPSGKQLRAGSG